MSNSAACAEFALGADRVSASEDRRDRFSFARFLSRVRAQASTPHPPLNARLLVDIGLSPADVEALGLR